jgi:hypothetical protein
MNRFRVALLGLGLGALTLTGCFITQAQIFAHFAFPPTFTINSATDPFERIVVDLNTIDEYEEHKDKLNSLSDFAVVGTFVNESGPAGGVEVWVTREITNYTSVGQVTANAVKLWGPGAIGASPSTRTIGWDDSAALFNAAGKALLLEEAKGDGELTLYTFGTAGVYDIRVENGFLVLTLNAGI